MNDWHACLTVALPADQQGDPVLVPVEIRFVLSPTLEDAPVTAHGDLAAWCSARGSYEFRTTIALLNDLLDASVCGSTLMASTIYNGVAMWQFLPEPMWGEFFLAVELVDAIAGIVDANPVGELRVFPGQGPVADVWEGVVRGVCQSRGIPMSILPSPPQKRAARLRRVRSTLRDTPLRPAVVWTRRTIRWIRARTSHLRVDLGILRATQANFWKRGRQPRGHKLLFASFARHWVPDPSNPSCKYDEQFYPILPSLRQAGWTRFVGIDCPYDRDDAALRERVRDAEPDVAWRDAFRARSEGAAERSRPAFERMLHDLLEDTGFTNALTYRGVPLVPAMRSRLEAAFMGALPACVQALGAAGRMLEREAPDAVMVSYETGMYAKALLIEADRRGIPAVGLQHGIILDNHNSYMHSRLTTSPASDTSGFAIPKRTLVWGPLSARILTEVGHYPQDAVATTGNWRYDSILRAQDDIRRSFREELALGASSRVVLVLSSGFNLLSYVERCLRAVSEVEDAVPLVKLHPAIDSAPIRGLIRDLGLPSATLVPDRMAAAMLASDLVVSQVSTAISEALLLGRPVVIADFQGVGIAAEGRSTVDGCIYVTEPEDLLLALRGGLDDPTVRRSLSTGRESAVVDHFLSADGMAGDRVATEVARLMAATTSPNRPASGGLGPRRGQA